MDRNSLGARFENFMAKLFRAEGFQVDQEFRGKGGVVADLLVRSSKSVTAVVEVKLYRSRNMPAHNLWQAATHIEYLRNALNADRSIIVVGNTLSASARDALTRFPDLLVYDLGTIAFLSQNHAGLIEELREITRDAVVFSEAAEPQPKPTDLNKDVSKLLQPRPAAMQPATAPIKITKGHDLCKDIHAIKPGKRAAKKFEEKVIEALKYIFDSDLAAFKPQKATDTRMSYFDLVTRVASDHDFWNAIASQFRSRYVIFEFKNYTEQIKQTQIYTTEKYLFTTALRSTAIVISRTGADANALAAARGALREAGKLIINLDLNDLCEMLHRRDSGGDHNEVLVDIVDEMLMKLER